MENLEKDVLEQNKSLKNKLFIFTQPSATAEDTERSNLDEDEEQSVPNIEYVLQLNHLDIVLVQFGTSWLKLKISNGNTYLFDFNEVRSRRIDAFNAAYDVTNALFQQKALAAIANSGNKRFSCIKKCFFKYGNIDSGRLAGQFNALKDFAQPFADVDGSNAVLTENMCAQLADILQKAYSEQGVQLFEEDSIVFKINGFPMMFYTDFNISKSGEIQFMKAIDPLEWFGVLLTEDTGNKDDKMSKL